MQHFARNTAAYAVLSICLALTVLTHESLEELTTVTAWVRSLITGAGVFFAFAMFGVVLSQIGARTNAEASEKRTRLLAHATRMFIIHSDEGVALQAIAGSVVPLFADGCGITVVTDVSRVEVFAGLRPDRSNESFSVPLEMRGEHIGDLSFVSTRNRAFDAQSFAVANELGRVMASAVETSRLHKKAEEANRLKDEFLATLSHELRTPLNAIIGWSHFLRSAALDEGTRQRALETIERNARQQAQIVSDLLDVSRIVLGQVRVERSPIELGAVLREAVDSLRCAAQAKQLDLRLDTGSEPMTVAGDRARFHQIMWNLISNAIKFTPLEGRVEVALSRDGGSSVIRVSDTGQGISPEFLPFIFEPFRQADGSSTRSHGGLGIGLAIVRHLVELHGGTIEVASPGPHQGTTFEIRLPLMAAVAANREDSHDEQHQHA